MKYKLNEEVSTPQGYKLQILSEDDDRYTVSINVWGLGYLYKQDGSLFNRDGLYYDRMFNEDKQLTFQACDCGGFKTYNTFSKEFHSHWCEVNKYG